MAHDVGQDRARARSPPITEMCGFHGFVHRDVPSLWSGLRPADVSRWPHTLVPWARAEPWGRLAGTSCDRSGSSFPAIAAVPSTGQAPSSHTRGLSSRPLVPTHLPRHTDPPLSCHAGASGDEAPLPATAPAPHTHHTPQPA